MSDFPSFLERNDSQGSALRLLARLGYTPLTPEETLAARGGYRSRAVLETILLDQLRTRRINHRGHEYTFSADNLRRAVEALRDLPDDGLLHASAAAHELLVNGKSLEQEIEGERSSFTIAYIDWVRQENNVFHMAAEFTVAGPRKDIRLDLVLFVNGIPFVVIECKRRDDAEGTQKAVADLLDYQTRESGAPHLFHLAQILIGTQPDQARYAVTGTPTEQWAIWKEEDPDAERRLVELLATDLEGSRRQPTAQDRTLFALCRPERLLELVREFILFDDGIKKIARYQQYFAVRRTMERIRMRDADGRRRGGVVWHTQGSGKSLTMVMLATAILHAPDIEHPRIILVTDRIDLDDQLYTTFENTRHDVVKAATGADLLARLESGRGEIITTVIDKYEAAARRRDVVNDSPNVFVMIDESHRSQYGKLHARMRKILPNACYLGFTGTPLTRAEKSTAAKFGGIIDAYTIDEAVADGAVVPLLYEGRTVKLDADRKSMDREFERIAESMTPYQVKLAKERIATEPVLLTTEKAIVEIAADIEAHWVANWKGLGFKAQLATSNKATALRYHRCFQESGKITTAVVISAPEEREGDDEGVREDVVRYWRDLMERYGSEKNYLKSIIAAFKTAEAPEMLIVVDKLLVGFDVPRNTVLYNTKSLHAHALLQAIARVNRVFPGKDHGYVIDYRGVLGDLDEAIQTYRALAEFDPKDVAHALLDIGAEIAKLPQRYSELMDLFAGITARGDISAYTEYLYDEKLRHTFYEKLSAFARTLQVALSSQRFHEQTSAEDMERYTDALKFFRSVRVVTQRAYAESVDFRAYEARIRKVMDRHVSIDEVVQSTPLVDILNAKAIEQIEQETTSDGGKADMIAHRLRRTLNERMEEDPILFARFSQLVQQAIDDYHGKRMAEAEYLRTILGLRDQVVTGRFAGIPPSLIPKPEARAYFGILTAVLEPHRRAIHPERWAELMAEAGEKIQTLIDRHAIVDWRLNPDVENQIRNDVEDYLCELKKELAIEISWEEIDRIQERVIEIARNLRPRP